MAKEKVTGKQRNIRGQTETFFAALTPRIPYSLITIPYVGTLYASRTRDPPLGGACYIHLTKRACARGKPRLFIIHNSAFRVKPYFRATKNRRSVSGPGPSKVRSPKTETSEKPRSMSSVLSSAAENIVSS